MLGGFSARFGFSVYVGSFQINYLINIKFGLMRKKILIIDDDIDLCMLLSRYLTKHDYETETVHSGSKGIAKFKENSYDLVISDYRLGDMEGNAVVSAIKAVNSQAKILVITGYSDIKTAVEIIKLGAYDYIVKSLIPDEVLSVVRNAIEAAPALPAEAARKNSDKKETDPKEYLVGTSPATRNLYEQINVVAQTN